MNSLSPVESRFPLVRDRSDSIHAAPAGDDAPCCAFGLRFFVPSALPITSAPASFYDEEQQVAVDEHGVPMLNGPYAGWDRTSTGNMDGNEETKMDQDPDTA